MEAGKLAKCRPGSYVAPLFGVHAQKCRGTAICSSGAEECFGSELMARWGSIQYDEAHDLNSMSPNEWHRRINSNMI